MTSPAQKRRMLDESPTTILGMMSERVSAVETSLQQHVTECAAMQKKVFGVVLFLSGWTVAHSPEAEKLIVKLWGIAGL